MSSTDKEPLYIHHHLGLGDHIICNGLVRFIQRKEPKRIVLVVKESNRNNVSRMYRDCGWIDYHPVETDHEFYNYHKNNPQIKLLRVEYDKKLHFAFDRSFYESVGVSFKERWDSWYLERDFEQENLLKREINLPKDFIFVHDQSSSGKFDLKIDSDLPVIKLSKLQCEKSIFDWMGVIEDAKEIHCIDSSIIHLINSMPDIKSELYFHSVKDTRWMTVDGVGLPLQNGLGFKKKDEWKYIRYLGVEK